MKSLLFSSYKLLYSGVISLAKKIEKCSLTQRNSQKFILALKQNSALTPILQQTQEFIAKLSPAPSLAEQILDVQFNLQQLKAQPLTAVQLNRLIQSEAFQQDIQSYFEQFKTILSNNVQVSEASRQILDPRCKSEFDFSSAIQHYKKGLLSILFLLLGFNRDKFTYTDEFITDYLSFLHHIYTASTISRIKLRVDPHINSDILVEIPRNTPVNVYGYPIHIHWLKIKVQLEHQTFEGYVQQSYLKSSV